MSNRPKTGVKGVPLEGRNANGQFEKGFSGNPGGRPKRTPEEQQAIDKMKKATPEMVDLVLSIAKNDNASFYAKLQAAELILNRSMGKPETYLRVENGEQSVEEATSNLMALFAAVDDEEDEEGLEEETGSGIGLEEGAGSGSASGSDSGSSGEEAGCGG